MPFCSQSNLVLRELMYRCSRLWTVTGSSWVRFGWEQGAGQRPSTSQSSSLHVPPNPTFGAVRNSTGSSFLERVWLSEGLSVSWFAWGTSSPSSSPEHIPGSTLTTGQRHCRCCRNVAGCSWCHLKGVAGQRRLPAAEAETLFTSWIFSKDVECDHSGQFGSLIVLDMHRNVLDGLQELVCIPCLETYMLRLRKVWNAYLSQVSLQTPLDTLFLRVKHNWRLLQWARDKLNFSGSTVSSFFPLCFVKRKCTSFPGFNCLFTCYLLGRKWRRVLGQHPLWSP